jgi:hypothetical protein
LESSLGANNLDFKDLIAGPGHECVKFLYKFLSFFIKFTLLIIKTLLYCKIFPVDSDGTKIAIFSREEE